MSMRNTGLVSVITLAVAVGCSSNNASTERGTFGGSAGSAGTSGSAGISGGGGTSGGSGSAGSYAGQGASAGFNIPDIDAMSVNEAAIPTNTDAACAADTRDSTPYRKDIIVVFDTSVSMGCDVANLTCDNPSSTDVITKTRISAIREAILGFVTAPESADIRVGLDVFPPYPSGDQCTFDYSQLNIPIAPASQNVGQFQTILGALTPHANTPTEQVLTGAYKAANAFMAANPGRSVAVVLVTDGIPAACNNTRDGTVAAALAKTAFDGTPSIETYVVGIGTMPALDLIALAGSGNQTHYIQADANAGAQLLSLLKFISTAVPCEYGIPASGQVDYKLVNVQARVGDAGTFSQVFKVDDASKCAAAQGGWYYNIPVDQITATNIPTKIILCGETCDPLKVTEGSSVQVLFGCPTKLADIF